MGVCVGATDGGDDDDTNDDRHIVRIEPARVQSSRLSVSSRLAVR